ncbi:hypothetical protein [Paenibacillus sp. R14(2021)]|uniref:hypothetical protein n=1 Tax=Paenibacillus sp. R14(2021) TaxID=2859228 RepID=UPI001C613531|nr:hypothetical protein [Paenibacillus sp. R14(2021)]
MKRARAGNWQMQFGLLTSHDTKNGAGRMILEKRQRSPLFPDANLNPLFKASGNNSDRKNIRLRSDYEDMSVVSNRV